MAKTQMTKSATLAAALQEGAQGSTSPPCGSSQSWAEQLRALQEEDVALQAIMEQVDQVLMATLKQTEELTKENRALADSLQTLPNKAPEVMELLQKVEEMEAEAAMLLAEGKAQAEMGSAQQQPAAARGPRGRGGGQQRRHRNKQQQPAPTASSSSSSSRCSHEHEARPTSTLFSTAAPAA
eukprot:CAMPEP_0179102580 /NCGR_PEP_ID=MMETSP0796-20121207/47485_1 /TAXON_ID=73915 /ORGANISM="Pyrodinium bahamense, Strain pbaha01" /LENGTH=181 /DNA_ID=CAMNT_0020800459 /DNA_START=36 /DNA_END=581 /DNA_ORIENTATION=+